MPMAAGSYDPDGGIGNVWWEFGGHAHGDQHGAGDNREKALFC